MPSPIPVFNRAVDPLIENVQLNQDPLLTQLVVGQPQKLPFPGLQLLTPITVPNWVFDYTVYNTEHLDTVDTRRGMRAPIKHGDWQVNTVSDKLKRYSFRVMKDQDEIGNAHPSLSIMEKSAILAQRMVTMDIEREIRDLVQAVGSYAAGNVLPIAPGSEWNAAGGDSRADIRAMTAQIINTVPIMPEDLVLFLPLQSLEAAKDDPVFLAARQNFDTNMPTTDVLAAYWGIGRVWSANPVDKDPATQVVGPMYGDNAILYYPGDNAAYDTTYGDITWAVNFKWNRGIAQRRFYDEVHTSWSFPWHDYAAPRIINNAAAALITNTAA